MYTGQAEKIISTVFTFGDRANITASAAAVVKGYLTAPGGTNAATTEFAVVIPRTGTLKNLYWSAETSTLTASGNSVTAYVKDPPTAAASAPTGLAVSWNGNVKLGSNITNTVPVVAGDTLSIYFQLAKGSGILTRLRVSIELEVDTQYPNPWDLTGPIVSYMGGNVGIGTASPASELHVKNATAGGIAGIFETPSGKILSGRVGASEKFSVDASGNLYASGKVGIGNTTPSTELDVNGTVQMQGMKLPTGANNGYVLTSDASGIGTWQVPSGGGGFVDGNGTPNAIARFLAPSTIDDSVIFQNGNNIGIGTSTPSTTLEVNGTIKSPMWNVTQVFNMEPGLANFSPMNGSFVTGGGTLLIFASGSGFVYSGGQMGMSIKVDGNVVGYSKITTNEMQSHKAFATNALVVTGIAAGSHTITLERWNNTVCDGSDFFSVTVLELPF